MASNRMISAALVAGLGFAGLFAAGPAEARVRVGVLECNIAPGVGFIVTSDQALSCRYKSVSGWVDYYVGTIRKFGLTIGFSGPQRLVWAVFAPAEPGAHYALAGEYVGATGSVSIGAGLGANVLVGGGAQSFALQPLSVSAGTGLNIAAGVGDLIIVPAHGPNQ